MTATETPKPIRIVCRSCGSVRVMRDAWAEWDEEAQEWVLQNVFDAAHCNDCDGETSLDEVWIDSKMFTCIACDWRGVLPDEPDEPGACPKCKRPVMSEEEE